MSATVLRVAPTELLIQRRLIHSNYYWLKSPIENRCQSLSAAVQPASDNNTYNCKNRNPVRTRPQQQQFPLKATNRHAVRMELVDRQHRYHCLNDESTTLSLGDKKLRSFFLVNSTAAALLASSVNINNRNFIDRRFLPTIRTMCSLPPNLNMENLNPCVKVMEYAVRGPLVTRAGEIEKELEKGVQKPFKEVIKANIGDCHAMGQVPITYIRQLLALVTYPKLFNDPQFPEDVKERACTILKGCRGGSVGSYTDSPGIEIIRRHVAQYIERRDGGIPSDWQHVVISAGASDAIKNILKLLICDIDGKKPGVMVPIPQYPLYSASLAEFNMHQIGYFLDENENWGLDICELQRAIDESKKVSKPRAIVVINPGNPTGQVLSRENIEAIIKFAHKEKLFILADEVYQDNVYATGSKFYSFKKVLIEMGRPYCEMELASFMSCSKGYMGECGLRGGYAEVINMCPHVRQMYLKAISAMLCPTVLGQATLDAIMNPPQKGEPSYELFIKEKADVLNSLKLRATMVAETFNSIEGISCNEVQGAMYAFPQIRLPPKAIETAQKQGKAADVFFAFELLEATGICIVPGTGFGQKSGTYHFRTTILPQPDKLKTMLNKLKEFHVSFIKKYS